MTAGLMVELVNRALPNAEQVRSWDLESEPNVVRFTWRGDRFRVAYDNGTIWVEEVDKGVLRGSNLAALMQALLQRVAIGNYAYFYGE